ncbi:hypothetical protein QVD17_04303 [Tagetes erecta]|uniref:Uncharacterized protein n=1 Tax=Tagetes erecta TaxID=13708 RepID=A0AAD8L9W0_TARER|nr:hypothetical protein QVD17_04303 [Tagetes erecta]
MESAAYYSPGSGPNIDQPKATTTDDESMKSENSLEALSVESSYKEEEESRGRTVEKLAKETDNLRDCLVDKENKFLNLGNKPPSKMKSLEDRIVALKVEIEALNCQKSEHEQEFKIRHDDFHKRLMKGNSGFQLEFAFKAKEAEVLKRLDECDKFFNGKIEESMNRVQNLEMEVDYLRSEYKKISHQKTQELESLRLRNQESEMEVNKKTKEALDSIEKLETLTEKLKQKTANEDGLVEERDVLRQQVKELEFKIEESMDRVHNLEMEVDSLRSQYENFSHEKEQELKSLRLQNQESEMELNKKTKEASDCFEMLESLTEKLKLKTANEEGLVEERDMLRQQVKELDRVHDLEMEVESLRSQYKNFSHEKEQELESLRSQNQESEMELNKKTKEALASLEIIESLTDKLKQKSANEDGLVEERGVLRQQVKELEFKIEESTHRVHNLEMEVDSLRSQYKSFSHEKEQELEYLRLQNQESEMEVNKMTKEASDFNEMLESLTEKLKQKAVNEKDLIQERNELKQQVKDLELKIESIKDENGLLKYENENQRTTISTLESEIERVKRDLSNKMKSLEQKLKSLEIDKRELEGKNDILAATLEERDLQVRKSNHEACSSFRATVKKMGEMVDECRKKTEDCIRIFSRRIRVAEQLQNETFEWYTKTREKNEQDRKDSELALHTIKILMSKVSDALSVSETFGLRFVECCEAFTNRISIVSCEMNFVKDWIKRKNGALVQLKKDFDELVVQLDSKEEEILGSRQKVLKLESKLRELEKIVKEGDETMIVLKEEKREAIRQLCMWIDYHRGRSDFYKKAFFELVARYQRPG